MQSFYFEDARSFFVVILYFFVSSFALYLPLRALWKEKKEVASFVIPVSWSVQMLVAYVFYSVSLLKWYSAAYFLFVLILNGVVLFQKRSDWRSVLGVPRFNMGGMVVTLFVGAAVLVDRCYDAITHIAPGNPDSITHLAMYDQLVSAGHISNAYYAPGFHLLLLPLHFFVKSYDVLRFGGAAVGVMTVLGLYLLFRNQFKNRVSSGVFLIALLLLPVFNRLGVQTIGFFSSSLTFLYAAAFAYLLARPDRARSRKYIGVAVLLSAALAVTVPYYFVQYIPAVFVVWLIAIIFRKRFPGDYPRYVGSLLAVAVLGFCLSFGHVYLQTKIVAKAGGFPSIPTISYGGDALVLGDNQELGIGQDGGAATTGEGVQGSVFYRSYIEPMISTGEDVLRVKTVVRADGLLGLAGWIWLGLGIVLLIYSVRKAIAGGLVLSVLLLVFGVATQTGILEMSFYRGRAGWYYVLFVVIAIVAAFDRMYREKWRQRILVGSCALIGGSMVVPPTYPRLYNSDVFTETAQIVRANHGGPVTVITDVDAVGAYSNAITVLPLSVDSLQRASGNPTYLILEKTYYRLDKALADVVFSPQKDLLASNSSQLTSEEVSFNHLRSSVMEDVHFADFTMYRDGQSVSVYKKSR